MRSTVNGFEGWYGTSMHITPDAASHGSRRMEAHQPLEMDDPITRKHLFGKDHWFMGAKNPNPDTMSADVKATYYTIPLDTEQ